MAIKRNDGNHFLNASFAGDAFRVCSVEDKSSSRISFQLKEFSFDGFFYLLFELAD